MKRKAFSLIELLVIVGVIALTAAILMPIFLRAKGESRPTCQNNLKQLGLGIMQYVQDYDERLPLILVTSTSDAGNSNAPIPVEKQAFYGWADAIYPYVKNSQIYHCRHSDITHDNGIPSVFAPLKRDCTDYWLNGKAAGQELVNVTKPAQTLVLGEGNDGDMTDARYNYSALPAPWLSDEKAPCYRHLDGANYCYLDGHVKWLKPADISSTSPQKGPQNSKATFALK